jgi:hypothetical protein
MELQLTTIVGCSGLSTEAITPMTGVTTDVGAISATRSIVGLDVQGPGENVTVTVSFQKRDGKIRFLKDRNDNAYCWADIKLSEKAVRVMQRVLSAEVAPVTGVAIVFDDGTCYPVSNEFGWLNHTVAHTEELEYTFESSLVDEADRITKGNVQLDKDGNYIFSGYRIAVYEKEDGNEITCSVPSKKGKKKDWVNKYTGYAGWMAKRLIPAIEKSFIEESGIEMKPRAFYATCDQCMSCLVMSYGQNQHDPEVSCAMSLRETVTFDQHWAQDLDFEVEIGNSIYLLHSEEVDDITCLPASKYHMESGTASNRGRVGYEIPGWFGSTERANEVMQSLYKALYLDLFAIFGDSATAGLATMWRDKSTPWDIELPGLLFPEEDESLSMQLGRFGDINDPRNKGFGMPEKDVLPEMDRIMELTANVHPLVARMLLEGSLTREDAEMFPNLRKAAQAEMLGESNPRMKRACSSSDYLKEAYSSEPGCLWFNYAGSRKPAYGAASYHARMDLAQQ